MPVRIPFDSVTLAAVVKELQPLVGGRVQRIVQRDRYSVELGIYSGVEVSVLLSCHPEFARMHAVSRRSGTGSEPPMFCQVLRKWLMNGQILSIRQRGLDRVVDIVVGTAVGEYRLVGEFMGKHSNLILVGVDGLVVGAAGFVPESKSKRPVLPLRPYFVPPFAARPSFLAASEGDDLGHFEGVSPFLRQLITATGLKAVQELVERGEFESWYVPESGAYPLAVSELGLTGVKRDSISQALEQHFAEAVERWEVDQVRGALLSQLKRVMLAREVARDSLKEAIAAAQGAPAAQRMAELVLAYQGQVKLGDAVLHAWDYEGNAVEIPLRKDLTAVENANRLFDKARRAKDRFGEVTEQLDRIMASLPLIEGAVKELEEAVTLGEVAVVRELAEEHKWLHHQPISQKKEDRPYAGFSIRELQSPAGWTVLYGTNATSNDYLTTKVAKPNDWWIHVRGQTSAHVVLVTKNQPEKVQRADLEYAARIAVRNSVAKNSSYVAVDYTLKKYVRKPRGSAAGFATYEREKTIHVDP